MSITIPAPPIEPPSTRSRLDLLIWWLDNRPTECGLTVTDLEPLIAKAAGHPVDPLVVEDLACAFALPTSTIAEQDERRERLELIVERLEDVTVCDGCREVIPEASTRWVCDDGSHWCHIEEHHAAHGHCHGLVAS